MHEADFNSESVVGYKIGGDSNFGRNTRLLFVTTGYLLTLLLNDPQAI